jgi:hypothetical protein
MKVTIRTAIIGLVVLVLLVGRAIGERKTRNVAVDNLPFTWPSGDEEASLITKQQVSSLLKSIATQMVGPEFAEREQVESYKFVNMDLGGMYLVAVEDAASTWFQEIDIIRCQRGACTYSAIHSEPENDLNRQVLSLRGDGRYQILGWESIDPNRERDLLYIYGVSDGKLKDESANYPEYYRAEVLPNYAKEAQELTPNEHYTQEMMEKDRAKLVYAQHDVERRIFGERAAGLSDAKLWEQSKNEDIRTLAVRSYEAIDSPEAEAGLKRMSMSESRWVSQRAQEALARKVAKAAP